MSAGILFASLTIAIFSKNYATRSYVHHSWLGAVLDFEPTHDVHTCERNERVLYGIHLSSHNAVGKKGFHW